MSSEKRKHRKHAAKEVVKHSDNGCRGEWVEEKRTKICHKVEVTRQEKRCRTVVKYRPVTKKVEIVVQEVAIREEERCKKVDDAFCTKVCKWVKVCVNGKSKEDCHKEKCCGTWVAAEKVKVCHDKKVGCPAEVKYVVQIPYVVDRKECVEVTLDEPYFEQEEYYVDVTDCETVCEWKEEKFPEPPTQCPDNKC